MSSKAFTLLTVFVLILSLSCQKQTGQPKQKTTSPNLEEKAKELGEKVAKKLLKTLKGELQQAIKAKGPAHAIEVCSLKALALTQKVSQETGAKVKRTTFKLRNPKNTPDEREKEALEYFAKNWEKKPKFYLQKYETKEGTVYRYYKPLKVLSLCLTCHGDPKTMGEDLRKALSQRYPQDKATGYKEGDFRGVIRVELPEKVLQK